MPKMMQIEDSWVLVFPRQGNYLYITLTNQVTMVCDYIRQNYQKERIEAISFSGRDKKPTWKFGNETDLIFFYQYLRENFSTGRGLRIRVKAFK